MPTSRDASPKDEVVECAAKLQQGHEFLMSSVHAVVSYILMADRSWEYGFAKPTIKHIARFVAVDNLKIGDARESGRLHWIAVVRDATLPIKSDLPHVIPFVICR